MSKNVDISRSIYKYVPRLLFEYFQKDKDMKVTLSKNKKELVSKLWSVSETNSKYTSNNIYYLLLLSQENIEISRGLLIMKQTMNKEDLIKMGYNPYTAVSIIRQAKQIMVQKGYAFYNNRRLGHVPTAAVEEILGVSLHKEE